MAIEHARCWSVSCVQLVEPWILGALVVSYPMPAASEENISTTEVRKQGGVAKTRFI